MHLILKVLLLLIVVIIIVAFILGVRILLLTDSYIQELRYGVQEFSKIPHLIFTYWDSEDIPTTVSKCIASWRKHNPNYKIVILNSKNYIDYIGVDVTKFKHADSKQRMADFIRLHVLEQNAGIWLDASVYLNQSLDWIHAYQKHDNSEAVIYYLDGFTTDKRYPVVENWFLSCIPNSKFIRDWKEEFMKVNNFNTVDDYVNNVRKTTDLQKIPTTSYLTMHVAQQVVMQRQKQDSEKYRVSYIKAEDSAFLYNKVIGWTVIFLPLYKYFSSLRRPLVKFRGGERDFIEFLSSKLGYDII